MYIKCNDNTYHVKIFNNDGAIHVSNWDDLFLNDGNTVQILVTHLLSQRKGSVLQRKFDMEFPVNILFI